MLDPSLIGRIDPVSKEIKEQEKIEEIKQQKMEFLQKQLSKKGKQRNNNKIREISKYSDKREQIRQNNLLKLKIKKLQKDKNDSEIAFNSDGVYQ